MNYTENYQLNQWDASDYVRREDFNEDNRKIEAALGGILAEIPRISFGKYIGSGTYGSSNPNSLTFPFVPKLVLISSSQSQPGLRQNTVGWFYGYNSGACDNDSNTNSVKLTWNNTTLQWYSESSAISQINISGVTYQYCVIG